MEMNNKDLVESIAYCGLVCSLCHLSTECDFCKNSAILCKRSEICFQRNCCIPKGLEGCWECTEFPCDKDMHAPPSDIKIKAFVTFIKTKGVETFIDCLVKNESKGIHYGLGKDYDGRENEAEVIALLERCFSSVVFDSRDVKDI